MPIDLVPNSSSPSPDPRQYLSVSDADVLAGQIPSSLMSNYLAASDDDKNAALLLASIDVDSAMRYQGRRYDVSGAQVLEFPRVPYESSTAARYYGALILGPQSGAFGGSQIWDYDLTNNVAVVPPNVKRAVVIQADSILAGDRDGRLQDIADGLASQQVGASNESYRADAMPSALCRRAEKIMDFYRLRQGRFL